MIAFRADANKYTATGHAMRCMSIADAIINQGGQVVFIVADEDSRVFIESRGYYTEKLDTDWRDMNSEIPKLVELLDRLKPLWLVVSSYQTTNEYLETINSKVKTLFIDDLNDRVYPVSAVLNYNIYAEKLNYAKDYLDKNTKLLLGTKFAPLRKQFSKVNIKLNDNCTSIFVSVGGTDNYGMAQRILNFAKNQETFNNLSFHIISGHFAKEIEIPLGMSNRVFIYKDVKNMAEIMERCDLAISAGGSTLYELCACGVPSVSYSLSDDQLLGVKEFDLQNAIPFCGDIRRDIDLTIRNIFIKLYEYIRDKNLREKSLTQMRQIVDGQGAIRLANMLK